MACHQWLQFSDGSASRPVNLDLDIWFHDDVQSWLSKVNAHKQSVFRWTRAGLFVIGRVPFQIYTTTGPSSSQEQEFFLSSHKYNPVDN